MPMPLDPAQATPRPCTSPSWRNAFGLSWDCVSSHCMSMLGPWSCTAQLICSCACFESPSNSALTPAAIRIISLLSVGHMCTWVWSTTGDPEEEQGRAWFNLGSYKSHRVTQWEWMGYQWQYLGIPHIFSGLGSCAKWIHRHHWKGTSITSEHDAIQHGTALWSAGVSSSTICQSNDKCPKVSVLGSTRSWSQQGLLRNKFKHFRNCSLSASNCWL